MIQWSPRVNSNKYSQHMFFWRNMENYLNTLICFTAVRQADRIAQLSSSNINRSISSGCFIQHLFQGQIQIFGLGAQTGLGVCVDGGGGGAILSVHPKFLKFVVIFWLKGVFNWIWISQFFCFFFKLVKLLIWAICFTWFLEVFISHLQPNIDYTSYEFQPTIWTTHIPANLNKEITQIYRKNPKNSDIRKICCNHPKIWTTRLYHIQYCF